MRYLRNIHRFPKELLLTVVALVAVVSMLVFVWVTERNRK